MPKRAVHERAIRGWSSYQMWRNFADLIDKSPDTPSTLRLVHELIAKQTCQEGKTSWNNRTALELVLKDKYPSFVVMERLRGDDENG